MGAEMKRYKRTHDTTTPALCPPSSDQISPHESGAHGALLSRAEIAARSASAATAAERRRWQVIGLLADGIPLAEIVAATGYRPRTIRHLAQRYRDSGPQGLVDGRQPSLGSAPLLSFDQRLAKYVARVRELRDAQSIRSSEMDLQSAMILLSGIAWTFTYIALVYRGFKDRSYGMPWWPWP
jgi:hypothetical protein